MAILFLYDYVLVTGVSDTMVSNVTAYAYSSFVSVIDGMEVKDWRIYD